MVLRIEDVIKEKRKVIGIKKGEKGIKKGIGEKVVINEKSMRKRKRIGKESSIKKNGVKK